MFRKLISIAIVAVLLSACMARRARIDEKMMPTGPNIRTVEVSKIAYDEEGRPLFDRVLDDRPSEIGEHYTIVVYDGQKAVRSFDIALVPHESADAAKPFKIIYEWTSSGYRFGIGSGNGEEPPRPVLQEQGGSSLLPDPVIRVAYAFSMTVGGFIVGVAASLPAAVLELANVPFSSRERLVSFTDYRYDSQGRLAATKMFLPSDRTSEIVHTEFFYEGDGADPSRAEIRNLVDGSVKIVP